MIGSAEHDFARRLVGLVLGIDALYRSVLPPDLEGLAREGWVAINLSRTPPTPITSYAQARAMVKELEREVDSLGLTTGRVRYFQDYLHAIETFCLWQEGQAIPYEELTGSLLGISVSPPDLEPLLHDLDQSLSAAGLSGETAAMIAAFRASRAVPRDQVIPTLTRYMDEARQWVHREFFPLPDDFQFHVEGEGGLSYNAYCEYVGRFVRINLDIQFTHEDLKHLACHEAYPGHSTHILRRELLVEQGKMTEDGLLVVTDTPTSPLFEGIGEIGLTLVGWDQTEAERINRLIVRLDAAVGVWAGHLFAQGRRDEGMALLRRYRDEAWAEARWRLIELPIRGPFICAYYFGDQVVHAAHARMKDQKAFLTHLYDAMHSPSSLAIDAR
ncbi:MAG TPA: hypothetical protein VIJ28_10070 [Chloroflexota bacterium]|jgi:hypothetical protein